MTNSRNDEADRTAGGTTGDAEGGPKAGDGGSTDVMPGVIGGGRMYLPSDGRAQAEGTPAASAPGTIGAVGEMDFTGAPAGTSGGNDAGAGSSEGASVGGGTGGGAMTTNGETGVDES
ncbi:MAG TPA: hypothetical protein VEY11_02245 [Pyrinomonadaceae bacterium]|nr:hypothetical protein [Pyrinomonadaceae bacterium]